MMKAFFLLFLFQNLFYTPVMALTKVKIALPSSMPPYIIEHSQSGIILDIVRTIYTANRYALEFHFFPNRRLVKEFQNKKYLTAFAIPRKKYSDNIYYSKAIVEFKNVAISLKENNLEITDIKQLSDKSITAFQNAGKFLGKAYQQMTLNNPHYDEVTDQKNQLLLLLKGRTEVIIMEQRIFWYHFKQLGLDPKIKNQFRFHNLFAVKERYCSFYNEEQRDQFDIQLSQLRGSNRYQEILNQYIRLDHLSK